MKARLADSVETALKLGNGVMLLSDLTPGRAASIAWTRRRERERRRPAPGPALLRAVRLPGLRHQPARDRAAHLPLQQPARRLPHLHGPGQHDGVRPGPDRRQDQEPGRRRGPALGPRHRDDLPRDAAVGVGALPHPVQRAGRRAEQGPAGHHPVRRAARATSSPSVTSTTRATTATSRRTTRA